MKFFLIYVVFVGHFCIAGDLRHTVQYPGLSKVLGVTYPDPAELIFCGDENIRLESTQFPKHFFLKPHRQGIVIKGLSGWKLAEWGRTLSAKELNEKIKGAAESSVLYVINQEGLTAEKYPLVASRIAVPETVSDCKNHGPQTFKCGSAHTDPKGCCDEGAGKLYGFELHYGTPPATKKWRLRFHPGTGNTNLTSPGSKQVLYCAADGAIVFLKD